MPVVPFVGYPIGVAGLMIVAVDRRVIVELITPRAVCLIIDTCIDRIEDNEIMVMIMIIISGVRGDGL